MGAYIIDWLSLLGRWVHMITGIAWIGASFYFIWLDNHLTPPVAAEDDKKGVGGELWAVHGGGFYHAQKYRLAPAAMPKTLHWFKWEAYTTWLTGMFLLMLVYWHGAEIYLIDPEVLALNKPSAIILAAAAIAGGWIIYDILCNLHWCRNERTLSVLLFVFVSFAAWGLTQVFSGRGAYMHFGAMLGTIMVANVFFVIMPGQRALVRDAEAGRAANAEDARRAKQRSVHNTYFTLPVLFVMISNHYAATYGSEYNWLALILISLAGAFIRIYFVQRHFGRNLIAYPLAAAALLLATAALVAPRQTESVDARPRAEIFAQVQDIMQNRCVSCHSANPTQAGFSAPPGGAAFDTSDEILRQAQLIHHQTVISRVMPIGNLTKITEQERAIIDYWYQTFVASAAKDAAAH